MRGHMASPETENNLLYVCVVSNETWTDLEEAEPLVVVENNLKALVVDDGEETSISKIINSLR